MIESIKELICKIKENRLEEIATFLNEHNIKHRPTNGDMYEGLAGEILNTTIKLLPEIKVTNGFIKNKRNNKISRQTDLIVYYGDAEDVPCTETKIVDIDNVIAIIEVKGSFNDDELEDFHEKQLSIYDLLDEHSIVDSSFDEITKLVFGKIIDESGLIENSMEYYLYHFLKVDSASPLRIQIGFDGFKKEETLRKHFMKLIETTPHKNGPGSLPNIIISDNAAIVKLFGTPYATAVHDDKFILFGSTNNPMRLFVESILSKIVNKTGIITTLDDFKSIELNPFIGACLVETNNGWSFQEIPFDSSKNIKLKDWEPYFCKDIIEYNFVNELCNGKKFRTYSNYCEKRVEDIIKRLVEMRIVGYDGTKVVLLTKKCVCTITPKGYAVGENANGQFSQWLLNN